MAINYSMEAFQKFSIWKQKLASKQKCLYLLSYLLVYPFWRARKHINYINENLELMDQFKKCLFDTISNRKCKVNTFKKTYQHELKPNQIALCDVIINEKITYKNMLWIEIEIEGLMNLIYSNTKHLSNQLFKQFKHELSPSELEVSSLIQTYTTLHVQILSHNKRFPWNQLINSLDLQKLELLQ